MGNKEKGLIIFQNLKGGGENFFHASLANIFKKCYKKAVFMKKNCIWVYMYIKYELKGGWLNFFYMLEGGLDFSCM